MILIDLCFRYEGDFSQGNFQGNGTFYRHDGMRYEGEFKDGSMHGLGEYKDRQCLNPRPSDVAAAATATEQALP